MSHSSWLFFWFRDPEISHGFSFQIIPHISVGRISSRKKKNGTTRVGYVILIWPNYIIYIYIIFHQPRFPWNKGSHFPSSATLWGPRSCEVDIIRSDLDTDHQYWSIDGCNRPVCLFHPQYNPLIPGLCFAWYPKQPCFNNECFNWMMNQIFTWERVVSPNIRLKLVV